MSDLSSDESDGSSLSDSRLSLSSDEESRVAKSAAPSIQSRQTSNPYSSHSQRHSRMDSSRESLAERPKRQISIAESNLTSRADDTVSLTSSAASSRYSSPTRSVTPNNDSQSRVVTASQASTKTMSHVENISSKVEISAKDSPLPNSGKKSVNQARSSALSLAAPPVGGKTSKTVQRDIPSNLTRQKMTTPYGHVTAKNGYIMVGKLRSARSGHSYPQRQQKVDPITARILSANQKKRAVAGNKAAEIKQKNMQLYEEIKSLRILCRNQEKSLKQFESTQSALPRVLQDYEQDKTILKERLRKIKDSEKRLEREKKRLDIENEKNQKKIKELNNIIQTKNLDDRFNLQQQLTAAESRAEEAERLAREAKRNLDLQTSALERQLKQEKRKRKKIEQTNQEMLKELKEIKEQLKEREKQLNYTNIYVQRHNKNSKKAHRRNEGIQVNATGSLLQMDQVHFASGDVSMPIVESPMQKDQSLFLARKAKSEEMNPKFHEPKLIQSEETPKIKFLSYDKQITNQLWSNSLALPAPPSEPSPRIPIQTPSAPLATTTKSPQSMMARESSLDGEQDRRSVVLSIVPSDHSLHESLAGSRASRISRHSVDNQIIATGSSELITTEVSMRKSGSSTFLTDIMEENESDQIATEVTEDLPAIPEKPVVETSIASPEPQSIKAKSPSPEPPVEVKPSMSETKSADALLDEMLFGAPAEKPASPVDSPQLFDLDAKPKANEESEFTFGSSVQNSAPKDNILAQLRDLHGNNSPDAELAGPPSKSGQPNKTDFSIFDDPPKIDPKEKAQTKEDELDALLNLGSSRKSGNYSKKKSDPVVYNFTEPINNLHQGKAAYPQKRDNLIDNLFGGGKETSFAL